MEVGSSLLDRLPVGIDIVDEKGEVLFLNKHLRDLAGAEVLGERCWQFYRDDKTQCADCPLRSGIQVDGIRTVESGGIFGGRTFQIGHFGVIVEGKKAMLEVFTDITQRRLPEPQVPHTRGMESLGALADGIAHEFNNILAIIQGHVNLLTESPAGTGAHARSVDIIATATARGTSLVRQLLRFSRKSDVTLEPVSINESIRELVSLLYHTFPRTIDIVTDLTPENPWLVADAAGLHQVLVTICVNARNAMPQGGRLTLSTSIVSGDLLRRQFPSAAVSQYIAVAIADTGVGMDEAMRQRVLDPFLRAIGESRGTGPGQGSAYGIVQSHSSFIEVQSEVGRGTTFRLFFPDLRSQHSPVGGAMPAGDVHGGHETILLVEDEAALREVATVVLSKNGYTVLAARDGAEAIDVYQQHRAEINLVITDLGLPLIGGDQLARTLLTLDSSQNVIIASGFIESETKSSLTRAGVREFIQKPYQQDELLRAIRRVIDGHGARTPVEPPETPESPQRSPAAAGAGMRPVDAPGTGDGHPVRQHIVPAVRDNFIQLGLRRILLSSAEFTVDSAVLTADELNRTLDASQGILLVIDEAWYRDLREDVLTRLKGNYHGVHTLLFIRDAGSPTCLRAIEQGLSCYMMSGSEEELARALRETAAGRQFVSGRLSRAKARNASVHAALETEQVLSGRERAVFRLTVLGKSTKDIARELGISAKTVSTYRTRVLKKLGMDSTAGLIAYAIRHNITG